MISHLVSKQEKGQRHTKGQNSIKYLIDAHSKVSQAQVAAYCERMNNWRSKSKQMTPTTKHETSHRFQIIFLTKTSMSLSSNYIKADSSKTHHSLTTAPVYWNIGWVLLSCQRPYPYLKIQQRQIVCSKTIFSAKVYIHNIRTDYICDISRMNSIKSRCSPITLSPNITSKQTNGYCHSILSYIQCR